MIRSLRRTIPYAILAACIVVAAVPWSRFTSGRLPASVSDFLTLFFGIMIEGIPFVLLGVLVSYGIRRWVSPERLARLLPRHPLLAYPATALLGLLFPVCECGNLPVARQLMRQGMRPSQAITLLLAAPIVNPAVIVTTWAAFRFMPSLVIARIALGFVLAVGIGWFFRAFGEEGLADERLTAVTCHDEHEPAVAIAEEFAEVLGALALGAFIASYVQLVVPRGALLDLGHSALSAILVMMTLAVVVSLCSTVDAFFALAFSATFSATALLAFLVVGPMVDFRSLSIMRRALRPRTLAIMTVLVLEGVFAAALLLHYTALL